MIKYNNFLIISQESVCALQHIQNKRIKIGILGSQLTLLTSLETHLYLQENPEVDNSDSCINKITDFCRSMDFEIVCE